MHKRLCEHVCVSLWAGWGYTRHNMDPSGRVFSGLVPVDRGRGREGEDDEAQWRLADGVQQGRSSLLMKSHLRPPFTLNMGHCSCPDLGFDPQRCLTPTLPQENPPPPPSLAIWTACMHMYTYVHTPTDTYACTRRPTQIHMHIHRFHGVGF